MVYKKGEGWRTARTRKSLSAPMIVIQDYIQAQGHRNYVSLDYGCGRGTDADLLGMDKFDPNWIGPDIQPIENRNTSEGYDIITNIYVLNVIREPEDRIKVLKEIQNLLSEHGVAFVAVRDDVPENTESQFRVYLNLELISKVSGRFRIYRLTRNDELSV